VPESCGLDDRLEAGIMQAVIAADAVNRSAGAGRIHLAANPARKVKAAHSKPQDGQLPEFRIVWL